MSLTFGGSYRSPSANKAVSTQSSVDFIQKVCHRQPTYLLLVGDFNYNDINRETFTVSESSPTLQPSEEFLEVLSTCMLYLNKYDWGIWWKAEPVYQ